MRNIGTNHKIRTIHFRLDSDIQEGVFHWLEKNPGLSTSHLANLAIRHFITEEHALSSIKATIAKNHRVQTSLKHVIIEHADMLNKLK
jgi:hypothetical protein